MSEIRKPSTPIPGSSLRPATPDDLDALVALEARVHPAPWTKSNFEGEWEKPYSRTWLLTDDDTDSEILGYVVFWQMDETVEILNIAVDFPYRGLGFAKRILQHVIREGLRENAKRLILDVRKSNLPAVALYQKSGMAITQVRKGFYSNGEDAYHFALELEGARTDF
jgi:ribosomal-protein-alanine N-acetyltransferase